MNLDDGCSFEHVEGERLNSIVAEHWATDADAIASIGRLLHDEFTKLAWKDHAVGNGCGFAANSAAAKLVLARTAKPIEVVTTEINID